MVNLQSEDLVVVTVWFVVSLNEIHSGFQVVAAQRCAQHGVGVTGRGGEEGGKG